MGAKKKTEAAHASAPKKRTGPRQAIPGARSTIFMVDPFDDLTIVGRDTKVDLASKTKPPLWDPRALEKPDPKFVKNIKSKKIKKPIIVRKVGDDIQVVDGRRRVINAREANLELQVDGLPTIKVPVQLENGSDQDVFETMIVTNAFTRLPSPVESAHLLQRYLSYEGTTEETASDTFGVTPRTIKNWLVMLKLDPKVQEAVEASKLSSSAAAKLVSLPPKEQRIKLKVLVAAAPEGKRVSVTKVARETGNASAAQRAPSKKLVKKLLALDEDVLCGGGLEKPFLLGVRWAIGDVGDKQVTGMSKLLRKAKK